MVDATKSDFHLSADANPGVRIGLGTGHWGITAEGTYHVILGRGSYSGFYGVLVGLSR